jgi:hypothetical protein
VNRNDLRYRTLGSLDKHRLDRGRGNRIDAYQLNGAERGGEAGRLADREGRISRASRRLHRLQHCA